MNGITADEPTETDKVVLPMETKDLLQANAPVLDVHTVNENTESQIPEYAIDRLARFFLPLMQESLSKKSFTHLQPQQRSDMMSEKEVQA